MKLAIQARLLPGKDDIERIAYAKQAGLDGLEFDFEDIYPNIPLIAEALQTHELEAAAINIGRIHLLHPDYDRRESAITRARLAMAATQDIQAAGVVFVPNHPTTPRLPDLHPYKSSIELEAELLVTQLRATLCDLAYAIGTDLYLAPLNRYETHLINTLDQAATVLHKNKDHPHLKVAANSFHMLLEEADILAALRRQADCIGYVHLANQQNLLPDAGLIDFQAVIAALKIAGYDGWLTIASDPTADLWARLPATVAMLRETLT